MDVDEDQTEEIMESEEEDDLIESSSEDEEDENEVDEASQVYIPGSEYHDPESLEFDESAYHIFHKAETSDPCLSFDIIRDNLGDNRSENYPHTAYLVGGTQSAKIHSNHLIIMKMSNMHRSKNTEKPKKDDESEDDEESDDEEEELPDFHSALVKHPGCVNRVRTSFVNNRLHCASWSEMGSVHIYDLSRQLEVVNNPKLLKSYIQNNESSSPVFSFKGHFIEGYAMDWSSLKEGVLATGDCKKNIHIWSPKESTWFVEQAPYTGHTASVEDIQWSPNEANVMASCSADKSIRIWDVRARPDKACKLAAENAHDSDVNVISWNRNEPFIISGGDDGLIKVWDLRQIKEGKPVAMFKHHTAPITSIEWHPSDGTVYAASGADNQLSIWDLSIEKDDSDNEKQLEKLPPQLLFIHQGQKDIKELHWHPQIPGLIISTAVNGFNIFRTISN
ncbi:Glutamate-rich WD repeat-containing protein 1 [Nymphon striatum]|nr:Glutamate-rich WD repeat-containing protein 1 [Nymphon striatum]